MTTLLEVMLDPKVRNPTAPLPHSLISMIFDQNGITKLFLHLRQNIGPDSPDSIHKIIAAHGSTTNLRISFLLINLFRNQDAASGEQVNWTSRITTFFQNLDLYLRRYLQNDRFHFLTGLTQNYWSTWTNTRRIQSFAEKQVLTVLFSKKKMLQADLVKGRPVASWQSCLTTPPRSSVDNFS